MSPMSSQAQSELRRESQSLACRQCRARKVKCDRVRTGCQPCSRLDLECSYNLPPTSGGRCITEGSEGPKGELTQAGLKRRRIRRACTVCRSLKAKCSGDQPCGRCQCYKLHCTYSDSHSDAAQQQSPQHSTISSLPDGLRGHPQAERLLAPPVCLPETPETLGTHSVGSSQDFALDRETTRRYLNTYFDRAVKARECIFLHRASVLTDWNKGTLDGLLLKAICALAAQLDSPRGDEHPHAVSWMEDVQNRLLASIEKQSVTHLQTIMLVIQFNYMSGNVRVTWMLLAIAARIAFTQQLNYEQPKRDPLMQESLRRLMWSIYLFDRSVCGGLEDLAVCPPNRLHIRLPITDYAFHHGLTSVSPYLNQPISSGCDMRVSNYYLRLMAIRDRILGYTKRVIREGSSPFDSQDELRSLEVELRVFQDELPEELRLIPQRLIFMAYSEELTEYLMIHGTWYQCNCDLYRFLVPGIRESVPQSAIDASPQFYVQDCQKKCLDNAILQCDLWSKIYRLSDHQTVNIPGIAFYLYQCINIIDNLVNLLPEEGDNCFLEVSKKLAETIAFVHRIRGTYTQGLNTWVDRPIKDCEKILETLGQRSQRQSLDSSHDRSQNHVFSKFSIIEANRQVSEGLSEAEEIQQSLPKASESGTGGTDSDNVTIPFEFVPEFYGQDLGFGDQLEFGDNYLAMTWSPFAVYHDSGQDLVQ